MYQLLGGHARSHSLLPPLQAVSHKQIYHRKPTYNNPAFLSNPETTHTQPRTKMGHDLSVPNLLPGTKPRGVSVDMMKNMLNQSYSQQIREKNQEQSLNRKLKIMQQNDYLSQFQKHTDFADQKNQQRKDQYRKELLTEIKQKKTVVDCVKTEERELERMYQEPRELSLKHKSQAYKQFYEEAKNYQREVERQYIDYMKVEQVFEKARNKDKITNYQPNFSQAEHHQEEESKLTNIRRQNLKRTLEQQMKVNEEKNRYRLPERGHYLGLKQRHNTILNPIDYKMDMNNKYVLSQIIQRL